jgi:alpha-L-fucosidase
MKKIILLSALGAANLGLFAQPNIIKEAVPTEIQLNWQASPYYWFMHFGPNTFSGAEWGSGKESASVFNPTNFDARQWCRLAKQAGAAGIIITAKHHDGFCLWPSKFSEHTVKQSAWRNGKGDVLKELSNACKEYGLKFGVYLSPWDRNHPDYGTKHYNLVFAAMLKEVLTNYGPVWELWWDGANGEGPNGKKQEYDWELFKKTVRDNSPSTLVFSDVGPDIRWVGNENGVAGVTNWNTLNIDGYSPGAGGPPADTLNRGNKFGDHWVPAECDVSIRPGWFYHAKEDTLVKSAEQLFYLYLKSVGRGANLLLNVPPNDKGLISKYDSVALIEFAKLRETSFKKDLLPAAIASMNVIKEKPSFEFMLKKGLILNTIVLGENLAEGQHCSSFHINFYDAQGKRIKKIGGTTIGANRILTFPTITCNKIEFSIDESKGKFAFKKMEAYLIDEKLIETEGIPK